MNRGRDDGYGKAQTAAFASEHLFAYLAAAAAIVLAALGVLEAFGQIDWVDEAAQQGTVTAGQEGGFFEGLLYLIPAASMAFLSLYFHTADHHRLRDVRTVADQDKAAWGAEHAGALIAGLTAIGFAVLGLLVGFEVIETTNPVRDGVIWQFAGLIPAILSVTLHQVRHHQAVADEDFIIAIVEERVGTRTTTPGAVRTEPGRGMTR